MPGTGEICQQSGTYRFVMHVDGSIGCHPRSEKLVIQVSKGEIFPPVKSCKKTAIWILVE
ncbi:MAG TPA: hypothetical protein VLB45_07215 [Nitrosopumilaceae archaeon]|nr:hypothetical protein [Nitrosopumilaceae archaeon]